MANVYSGLLWMLLEAPVGARHAAKYLAAAERAAPDATRREQLNTAVLRAWVDDDLARTLRLCEQISDEFPRDLVIVMDASASMAAVVFVTPERPQSGKRSTVCFRPTGRPPSRMAPISTG